MKTKCPMIQNRALECDDEFDRLGLSEHIGKTHSFMDISVTLVRREFKIHELMKNCDRYIGCSELKSLLE